MKLSRHFQIGFKPLANPEAITTGKHVRFTVLTSRVIRMEFDESDKFEDRASQVFWYRDQPAPIFKVNQNQNHIMIDTEYLKLNYSVTPKGFSKNSLSIILKKNGTIWRFGECDEDNLKGTARTLDGTNGGIALQPGLMSRSGWSLIDDSNSLVFNENGWVESRNSIEGSDCNTDKLDLYFFGFCSEYKACLSDYYLLTGQTPMLPRFALGNWWSRYHAYSQKELLMLMDDFEKREIPLSTCIVDMDWHIVKNDYTRGWTGYTWNKELFEDPEEFLKVIHEKGLKCSLNLHPADGIHPHEEMFEAMAKAMGNDPEKKEPVKFDITDIKFIEEYFSILHHPYERSGIDFWWMDWQQGSTSKLSGLDPLWCLNHLHFYDLGRDGVKRPFVFSRYGGLGSHRYPIGFSGDTTVSWDSLRLQPYFTSTAANAAYGWWSHDIGGHTQGFDEPELYTRWVQWGVFSPIFRIHCTAGPLFDRRPWACDENTFKAIKKAMQLRHSLIPYIYTMNWRNFNAGIPLITPMYYDYPDKERAYQCPHQYMFGSELIASPFVYPEEKEIGSSRQRVWLPEGEWFDFFTGEYFKGDKYIAVYGNLNDIPVFAKAGAIVPMGPLTGWGGILNPDFLEIHSFAGKDGKFELYEDDGETVAYTNGKYSIIEFTQEWKDSQAVFRIKPVSGSTQHLPMERKYRISFKGVKKPESIIALVNNAQIDIEYHYEAENETFCIEAVSLKPSDFFEVVLSNEGCSLMSGSDRRKSKFFSLIKTLKLEALNRHYLLDHFDDFLTEPSAIEYYAGNKFYFWQYNPNDLKSNQIMALTEVLRGCAIGEM